MKYSIWAVSKMPPDIPVTFESGRPVTDLRLLLADTNNLEIKRVFLCRRTGVRCYETLWSIEFPEGWIQPRIVLSGDYPGAVVKTMNPGALQLGGSYNLYIKFNERSRWHKQTVSSTHLEFCVIEEGGAWQVQDSALCLARRNAEERQSRLQK
ncbi:hypothetical protein GV819_32485 [Pseudomonas sp. Fl5BN2]|uniref:hypothetical protein n=1 Tax=unclassified Pseudomonas TaxID=196821 RepID=UPI001376FBA5|nr:MULTISPECIES: hypothetical protein [unclassified Pseudomonas]NBF06985.1 hypothetical protein [Pseudomonas sp. Fl5BN2]NBF13577.1 hypothetical protein [Pseudomonas sp. Fl4BN1]